MRIILLLTLLATALGGCAKRSEMSHRPSSYRYRNYGGARTASDSAPASKSMESEEARPSPTTGVSERSDYRADKTTATKKSTPENSAPES
ncbi:hypothetical protein KJ865_12480, partial [Myxococcota bacterium]|nr:hypothetical protein [Myxococcota bacterium]